MNDFFKKAGCDYHIALFRAIYCLYVAIYTLLKFKIVEYSSTRMWHPVPLFDIFEISQWSHSTYLTLYVLTIVFFLLAAAGIGGRLILFLSAIFFFFHYGHYLSTTKQPDTNYVFHSLNIFLYLILTLCLLPSTFNIKIQLFKKKLLFLKKHTYLWEEKLILLVICSAYFGSGFLKILAGGLKWANGETVIAYILRKRMLWDLEYPMELFNYKEIWIALSLFVLALEAFLIFGLLFKRSRWIVLFSVLGLHYGIYYFMKIDFIKSHFAWSLFFCGYLLDWVKRNGYTDSISSIFSRTE